MKPRLRVGLVVGGISIIPSFLMAFTFCCMVPFLALFVGSVAGYFAAIQEKPRSRDEGAGVGAIAAGIAGGLSSAGILVSLSISRFFFNFRSFDRFAESLTSNPGNVIKEVISIGAMGLFVLAFYVAAGTVTGYTSTPNRSRASAEERLTGN